MALVDTRPEEVQSLFLHTQIKLHVLQHVQREIINEFCGKVILREHTVIEVQKLGEEPLSLVHKRHWGSHMGTSDGIKVSEENAVPEE